jgi:Na+-driven multidrug efflux pump
MLCAGLGNARGALLLSTARQGTCFLPILFPLAHFFGVNGVASVQAMADLLTLIPAIPLALIMMKRIRTAREEEEKRQGLA